MAKKKEAEAAAAGGLRYVGQGVAIGVPKRDLTVSDIMQVSRNLLVTNELERLSLKSEPTPDEVEKLTRGLSDADILALGREWLLGIVCPNTKEPLYAPVPFDGLKAKATELGEVLSSGMPTQTQTSEIESEVE